MALDVNYILRLKRNDAQFLTKKDALNNIKIQLSSSNILSGEMLIVTYIEGGVENVIIGIKGLSGGYQLFEGASFDGDGNLQLSKSIQDAIDETLTTIQNKIDSLDYTDTVDNNKYVTSVTQTDGQIAVTKQDLISSEEGNMLENKNGSLYLSNVLDCGTYTKE